MSTLATTPSNAPGLLTPNRVASCEVSQALTPIVGTTMCWPSNMSWPEARKAAAGSQMSSRRLTYSIRIDIGTNGSSWVPHSISQWGVHLSNFAYV